jgi:tartrate-resistant acid phosphatase type 5
MAGASLAKTIMLKNIRSRVWILLFSIALVVGFAGWYFRHPIRSEVRRLTLPNVGPPLAGTIRFAVIGDYGSGSYDEGDVAQLIESWRPDFIATVGDNNYLEGGVEALDQSIGRFYHGYISPYKGSYGQGATTNRFFPIPGHRDWDSGALRPYLDYFTLPGNGRYYDFVRGPVHFFMLDTDEREPDGATADSVQAAWLKQRLAETKAPWKLVFGHHAPYTSHKFPATERMRWPFKEWGADAVLSGFYHIYERLLVDGLPYFIDGAGGTWTSFFGEVDPHSQFRYREDFGAMLIDASDTRITFRFVNREGRITDACVLVKREIEEKAADISERSGLDTQVGDLRCDAELRR